MILTNFIQINFGSFFDGNKHYQKRTFFYAFKAAVTPDGVDFPKNAGLT